MGIESKLESLQKAKEAALESKAMKRLQLLFDEGTFVEIDALAKSGEVLAEAVAGFGAVDGCPVYAFAQNSDVSGGAMSKAQAAKIHKIYDLAIKTGAPVVGIFDSAGARLNEGTDMLAAYGDMLLSSNNLSGVVPQISLVLGPCLGTNAVIAASADLVVAAKRAEFGIETNGSEGPVEEDAKAGLCHLVAEDEGEAIAAVRNLVTMLPSNNLSGAPITDFADAPNAEDALRAAAEKIASGEAAGDISAFVADAESFVELQKGFGSAVTAGLAKLGGGTVGMLFFNGAYIDADSCDKAARLIRFCDAFAVPVVSFVDAPCFASLRQASKLSNAYSEATTVKVTVVTGAAYGPVYVAVAGRGANADLTLAWPSAAISALAPETAAVLLWSDRLKGSTDPVADRQKLVAEYKETEASPEHAAAAGYVEDIIDPADTRAKLIAALDMLAGKRVTRLPKKHANIQI